SIFFFSSRRRHTRCLSDWSSDVCSSDLRIRRDLRVGLSVGSDAPPRRRLVLDDADTRGLAVALEEDGLDARIKQAAVPVDAGSRSEERRVGKESRLRMWQYREKQTAAMY